MPYIVAKAKCSRTVCINGEPAGPANQPLPVVEGTLVVSMDCACGVQPAQHSGVFGGPLSAPAVVSFVCGEAGDDA
jgi:hypothetical protein